MTKELEQAAEIAERYGCEQANLIAILQEIQAEHKYLSEPVLTLVAEKLGISVAKVYSVTTFYENFSLEPKGKYVIKVCAGTACHVRKSQPIYDAVREYLGLRGKKKTSADGLFTLETVACLGACGLAPVMTVDGEVHAKMTPDAALELLEEIRRKEGMAQ
jgi:NADH-quinone oxidoreductase subunit E